MLEKKLIKGGDDRPLCGILVTYLNSIPDSQKIQNFIEF